MGVCNWHLVSYFHYFFIWNNNSYRTWKYWECFERNFLKNVSRFNLGSLFFVFSNRKKTITIERNEHWEINTIQMVKLLNKRWCDWQKWNFKVIKTFETSSFNQRNKGWKSKTDLLNFISALRVLNDYDQVLSHQIFKLYK